VRRLLAGCAAALVGMTAACTATPQSVATVPAPLPPPSLTVASRSVATTSSRAPTLDEIVTHASEIYLARVERSGGLLHFIVAEVWRAWPDKSPRVGDEVLAYRQKKDHPTMTADQVLVYVFPSDFVRAGGGSVSDGSATVFNGFIPAYQMVLAEVRAKVESIRASDSPVRAEAVDKLTLRPVKNPMPPNPPGVYDVSKVSRFPAPTFQARPRYPAELRQAGVGGEGVVSFIIGIDGGVEEAVVVSATDVRFGQAAMEAVLKWKFRPAELNGMIVRCHMMVPIVFTLNAE
jgi:TonB family protein